MDKVCLFNISPIDGRYNNLTNELSFLFSEFSFIKQRVIIEIHYFNILNCVLQQMLTDSNT